MLEQTTSPGSNNSSTTVLGLDEIDEGNFNQEKKTDWPSIIPLKRSEAWAWYLQNATYCGYAYVSAPIMVPLLIQDIAARAGVDAMDHSQPCNPATAAMATKCVTLVFGSYLDPGQISLYISSLSSILSFFVSLSICAVADHGDYKKSLLVVFSIIGSLSTIGFFALQLPSLLWSAAIFAPLAWVSFNICGVFSHSFLPLYGRVHPEVLEAEKRGEAVSTIRKITEQKINDISTYSTLASNCGCLVVYGVCIGLSWGLNQSTLGLQFAIASTGILWLAGILVAWPWLDARSGPPMPKGTNWVFYSWAKTYHTIRAFKQLKEAFKFLVAWYMLSDGVNTVLAILFLILYRELHFSQVQTLTFSVLLTVMAVVGAWFFMTVRRAWKLSTKTMITIGISVYMTLVLYAVITPLINPKYGMRFKWEGWVAGLCIGFIISTFYSSTRVMLSELCPEGDENEWFSIYLLADKGSSWLGPLVTGLIYGVTKDYRTAFWFPLGLIIIGSVMLYFVDVDLGKDQAKAFTQAKREEKMSSPC